MTDTEELFGRLIEATQFQIKVWRPIDDSDEWAVIVSRHGLDNDGPNRASWDNEERFTGPTLIAALEAACARLSPPGAGEVSEYTEGWPKVMEVGEPESTGEVEIVAAEVVPLSDAEYKVFFGESGRDELALAAAQQAEARLQEAEEVLRAIAKHEKTCTAGLPGPQPCLDAVVKVARSYFDPQTSDESLPLPDQEGGG